MRCTVIVFMFLIKLAEIKVLNNVCGTVTDYYNDIENNANCWYDPDVNTGPEERAKNHGLILERHHVETEDHWILVIYRIKSPEGVLGTKPIYLQHGYAVDSTEFMGNGENSVAFFLAKHGFDVWLGNVRGSDLATHRTLSKKNPEYWNFSFHEIGTYDIHAGLKYVAKVTGQKVCYVGHSMGGTAMVVYLTTRLRDAQKLLKHTVLIGAPIFMKYSFGIAKKSVMTDWLSTINMIQLMSYHVILTTNSFERKALLQFCLNSSLADLYTCMDFVTFIGGPCPHPLSPEKLPLVFPTLQNLVVKPGLHYIQNILSGDFKQYDYGSKGNLRRYNSTVPPVYDLSKMSTGISFISSTYDSLNSKEDHLEMFAKYKKPSWDMHEIPYNHVNLMFNRKAKQLFLRPLLDIINKYT